MTEPTDPQPDPNYMPAVLDLVAELLASGACQPGTVIPIYIAHDDACPLRDGGVRDCEPTVTAGRPDCPLPPALVPDRGSTMTPDTGGHRRARYLFRRRRHRPVAHPQERVRFPSGPSCSPGIRATAPTKLLGSVTDTGAG